MAEDLGTPRHSSLSLMRHCGYVRTLNKRYPQGSTASEAGTSWHKRMEAAIHEIIEGKTVSDPDMASIIAALPRFQKIEAEVPIELKDSETGAVISETKGVDVVLTMVDGSLVVGDWKTGSQSRVSPPNENLQLKANGLALAIARGAKRFKTFLFFPRPGPGFEWGDVINEDQYWDVLDEIKKAVSTDTTRPVVGEHCNMCFQRQHCYAYVLPAMEMESALAPLTEACTSELTDASASAVLSKWLWMKGAYEQIEKVLRPRLEDYARANNGIEVDGKKWEPCIVRGRQSVSVEAIKAAGLWDQLKEAGCVSEGRTYESFRLVNITKRGKRK